MIIDSSAVVAFLKGEDDALLYDEALSDAASTDPPSGRMSAATLVEVSVVIDGAKDPVLSRQLDDLMRNNRVVVEPFTADHARIARDAYRDFGRGSGHPARLNIGDCFSYALAKATDEPLLYKGEDFVHTDVRNALTP